MVKNINELKELVYSSNGVLYVESLVEQDIEVYTIDGLLYYSAKKSLGFALGGLDGIVIIRVGNRVYKSFVK